MDIIIPDIEHKYITLFETQQGYDAAAPNFIEVNWSAVKDTEHPEETPVPYQPSTRPTHGYEPVDNVDVFPDSSVRMLWYTYDHIYKTFFLEIIWGYSGWEWVDYEYTDPDTQETSILKGGNLYKVKEITEVPSIPDGYRLEHINNFLNSQDKVTHVCWFDTSNIKSMRSAFTGNKPLELDIYSFPEVKDAYRAFYSRNLSIINNETLLFQKIKEFDETFNGVTITGITINAPLLTTAHKLFYNCTKVFGSSNVFNLSDHLVSNYSGISDFSEILDNAHFDGNNIHAGFIINMDLTSNTSNEFNLNKAFRVILNNTAVTPATLTLNLSINKPTTAEYLCSGNKSVVLTSNIQGTSYITDAKYAFAYLDLYSNIPYTQPLNATVNDNCIYYNTKFRNAVTYDFSPNGTSVDTYSHFSYAAFYNGFSFSHVDCLDKICFYRMITYSTSGSTTTQVPFDFNYDLGTSSSTYKIIDFRYSGLRTLRNQTIYSITGNSFAGCSNLAMDNSYTYYTNGKKVNGLTDGGTISYIATYPEIDFSGTNITSTPVIWYDGYELYRAGDIFTGPSTLQRIILGMTEGSYYHSSTSLNLISNDYPNLVYLVLNSNMKLRSLNLKGQLNLDIPTLEQSLTIQTIGTLTIQMSVWDSLSAACQSACRNNINVIDLIREDNEQEN